MSGKMYVELLKNVLTDYHRMELDEYKDVNYGKPNWKMRVLMAVDNYLRKKNFVILEKVPLNKKNREEGRDWPAYADTMIGLKRLNNIEYCVEKILEEKILGDFIETGVWRGGATIFMNALLKSKNVKDRTVWVADSFEGLPKPNEEKYKEDQGDLHYTKKELAISIDTVKSNFDKYGLLDDNVKFLKGWFNETLPKAPIEKLSLLRLDGDMYESTIDALSNLYPKLSIGGYIIIDDYGAVPACKKAVADYRESKGITDEIEVIDWASVFWKKS